MDRHVFLDVQSIAPGSLWERDVERALRRADVVVTFWCVHSSESTHVEWEWRMAEKAGKRLLPVLLDDTTLPDGLGRYQGIDFRGLVRDSHKGSSGETMNAFNPLAFFVWPLLLIWAAVQALFGLAQEVRRGDKAPIGTRRWRDCSVKSSTSSDDSGQGAGEGSCAQLISHGTPNWSMTAP